MRIDHTNGDVSLSGNYDPTLLAEESRNGFPAPVAPSRRNTFKRGFSLRNNLIQLVVAMALISDITHVEFGVRAGTWPDTCAGGYYLSNYNCIPCNAGKKCNKPDKTPIN